MRGNKEHIFAVQFELTLSRKRRYERQILLTAKLFATSTSINGATGFDWILEIVSGSTITEMTSELEIAKAIQHLKKKEFPKVVGLISSSL